MRILRATKGLPHETGVDLISPLALLSVMRWTTLALAPLIAVLVVAGTAAAAVSVGSPSRDGTSNLAGLITDAVAVPAHASTQPLSPTQAVSVTLTLANPHEAELDSFLAAVENPRSPLYRHFVTFSEYVNEFAPPVSSVHAVESVLSAAGGTLLSSAPDRSSVSAVLPASSLERLLGVSLVTYGHSRGTALYTATGTPVLPSSLAGLISGVGGLSNEATVELASSASSLVREAPLLPLGAGRSQFVYAPGYGDWYVGSDYTQAYGATQLLPGAGSVAGATYPTSVAIATILISGYNDTLGQDLPPWDPAVIQAYFNATLAPGWPMPTFTGVPVTVDGVTPPAPGSFGNVNDDSEDEVENSLDLEMAGSMAPGSSLYNFYISAALLNNASTDADAADELAVALGAALSHSYTPEHLAAVSCSFGLSDLQDASWNAELQTASALGVTITASSGDQGNAPNDDTGRDDGQWPVWPASAVVPGGGAVAVGGTTIEMSGTSTSTFNGSELNLSYDAAAGQISSVAAWYDTTGGPGQIAGTEGGVSSAYSEPSWQVRSAAQPEIVNATVTQGASALGRAEPDIAMVANNTIATIQANDTGAIFFTILEGTSVASPVFAGLVADIVAVENNRLPSGSGWTSLGFIDPEIYNISSYYAMVGGASGDPFSEVTTGENYVFTASSGWDALTGWGEVSAPLFLAADENPTLLHYNYTGPSPGLPPGYSGGTSSSSTVPWALIFLIFGIGLVVAIVLIVIALRPSRPRSMSSGVPLGAQWGVTTHGPGPESYYSSPGATFLCPYCGGIRPAEPVACPQCGAY